MAERDVVILVGCLGGRFWLSSGAGVGDLPGEDLRLLPESDIQHRWRRGVSELSERLRGWNFPGPVRGAGRSGIRRWRVVGDGVLRRFVWISALLSTSFWVNSQGGVSRGGVQVSAARVGAQRERVKMKRFRITAARVLAIAGVCGLMLVSVVSSASAATTGLTASGNGSLEVPAGSASDTVAATVDIDR